MDINNTLLRIIVDSVDNFKDLSTVYTAELLIIFFRIGR